MNEDLKRELHEEIARGFQRLTPEAQQEFMAFEEKLHTLKPGEHLELRGSLFSRNLDGSLSVVAPKAIVDACERRFPRLDGELS